VVFTIGVTYQTTLEKVKEIPLILKKIIVDQKNATFDRAHFKEYGPFSLNFEAVYYVIGADFNQYMDIQQSINLTIYEEFSSRKIEFAYPTQTLFVQAESKTAVD
jgi:small-conductance mechanosensitive channel